MRYRYTHERANYEDLASGRVLYGRPGNPTFPVRLASEVFQRCLHLGRELGMPDPCTLFDPCCGAGYHLCALGYLHAEHIGRIVASDIDSGALELARRNLSLLTRDGLAQRTGEIERLRESYGKKSHAEALSSAKQLQKRLRARAGGAPETLFFLADATDARALSRHLEKVRPDIVFADVPYGWHAQWIGASANVEGDKSPLWRMLNALRSALPKESIVAVSSSKAQRARHEGYAQLQRLSAGRRQITILRPAV